MSRRRFIVLLVAALLVITGGLYLSARRNVSPDAQGALLLPTFTAQMNTVTALSVRKGGTAPSVTVHQSAGKWTVLERGDYPADVAKLRKLLLALGEARIVEQKTSNPGNFPVIGVEDPAQPGAAGAEITVTAQDGKHAVIVGKPIGEGNFARRSGENTSYVVEPAITFETEPRYWIETRLIDVPAASIQSIEVKPASGAGYVIRRLKPNEDGFGLEGTPAGRKALDAHALAPSSTLLSGLSAEDVAAAKDIDFGQATQAILTLSDGNVISLSGTPAGEKRWIEVKASKDATLMAKSQDRAFEVASYRYDALFRPLEQLLVPKESPPGKNTAAGKPAPGHKPAAGGPAPGPSSPAPSPAP